MPELFIIDDEWNLQPWFSTGGTRAKLYLQSPKGQYYYFKRSQYKDATAIKPGKDFKYEFWSEVIASEIGITLGFNMLRYDIAIYDEIMGCISKSMIRPDGEELIEGVKYLQGFSTEYDPENKQHRTMYTFHLIEQALKAAKLDEYISHIIELIVFDALIGNGDRHQENWAFITHQELMSKMLEEVERHQDFSSLGLWRRLIWLFYKKLIKWGQAELQRNEKPLPKSYYHISKRPAPIYDSGSSLGRELTENRVQLFLSSETELNHYIDRGVSEIHWNNEKLSHFALTQQLLDSKQEETVLRIINRIVKLWDISKVERIVHEVDVKVPDTHAQYRIPNDRKELIIQIISLRYQRLVGLLHAGI